MKKLATILLLIVTLQYTFGLYAVYVINAREIKQRMHQAIASGIFKPQEVVTLHIPLQDFNELKDEYREHDEMSYRGKMYDIITTQQQGSYIMVKGICDEDETKITASFLRGMQKGNQFPVKRINDFSNAFSPFILDAVAYTFNPVTIRKTLFLQKQFVFMNGRFQHVPTPPPWQVS